MGLCNRLIMIQLRNRLNRSSDLIGTTLVGSRPRPSLRPSVRPSPPSLSVTAAAEMPDCDGMSFGQAAAGTQRGGERPTAKTVSSD